MNLLGFLSWFKPKAATKPRKEYAPGTYKGWTLGHRVSGRVYYTAHRGGQTLMCANYDCICDMIDRQCAGETAQAQRAIRKGR